MAFKSSDSQNSEGRNRGGKDPKKKMKKMRSIKLPKLSSLNSSSSKRATWQFDLSAIDLAIDELNSESKMENFEVETESEDTSESSSSNPKSRSYQTPDNSTPHDPKYSKKSGSLDRKISTPNFTRTPSIRSVRILKSRASFKSKRPLMKKQSETAKDLNVERATCSSTLKDSKFSKEIDLLEGENQVEKISALKVCPYHHCSLYGHCHGSEPVEKKPFLRRKKRPIKIQKSKRRENEESDGGKILFGRKSESEKVLEEYGQENGVGDDVGRILFGGKSKFGKSFQENEGADVGEVLFGRKSESGKVLEENVLAVEKEQMDLSLSGNGQENGVGDVDQILFGGKSFQENEGGDVGEILFGGKSESGKILEENDFAVEKEQGDLSFSGKGQENRVGDVGRILFGGKTFQENFSQENAGDFLFGGTTLNEKSFQENEDRDSSEILLGRKLQPEKISQENESENADKLLLGGKSKSGKFSQDNPNQTSNLPSPQLKKESSISMWQLIHRQMVSSLKEDHDENQAGDSNNFSSSKKSISRNISDSDMSTEETEIRKNFAIKLVREAIEKILLPEVQDQSSDDQSISEQENLEENISISNEISKQEKSQENGDNGEVKKDESSKKRSPKSWSYLKKVILLKRFVKELERVREFRLKKVRSRPLDLDQEEAEKISLRPQTTNGKRNSEEWMLDYAIRKVVSDLAPNQKKKVALLVKAFETVAPSQDDQPIKVKFSVLKGNNHQDFESNEVGNVVLSSNFEEINTKIEENGDSTTLAKNFVEVSEENKAQMEDNESDNHALKVRVIKRENHISMWHLIHDQMVSGLQSEETKIADDVSMTSASNGIESEETKMQKSFAVKLVREAIEKILLPEVQDQSFDDQSTTSDVKSDQDLNEKNRDEDFGRLKANNTDDDDKPTDPKEGNLESEKQKPKSWSYLKKVILLKRFVKELEKVKKFNPRKPNYLPLEPGQEPEKVSLRPQTVGQKRNTDEWMLDYAIRQVVSQFAPTQKQKVALLVKAFETVAPPNEDNPKIVSQSSGKFTSQDDITDLKSNLSENFVETKINIPVEKQNNIKMWHMVYQHVVSGIAEKVVADEEFDDKNNAVKLVQEAVDEILDDSSDSQSTLGDSITTLDDCQSSVSDVITPLIVEKQKSKNWSKLKKLILLKRSIKALGNVRKRDPQPPKILAVEGDDVAKEKVDLKSQMVDERKKAEQWMLDYAVQHIVTKLTPARKRRVAMLVEAFEAVVPLPES